MKRKLHQGMNLAAVLLFLVSAIPGRLFAQAFGKPHVSVDSSPANIGGGAYTLNGHADANGALSTIAYAWFEWGTSTAYGNTSSSTQVSANGSSFSANLSGLAGGTVYHYRGAASNYLGTAYTSDVSFTTVGPPVINSPPQDQVVGIGGTINLTVSASSGPPFDTITYQWQKDGNNIASANSSSYSVSSATTNDAGVYKVLVENGYLGGYQISGGTASVSVGPAPTPTLQSVSTNGNLVFSWPVYQPNYQLQSSTNLNSSNWISAGGALITNNNVITVTLPMPGAKKFFRLKF